MVRRQRTPADEYRTALRRQINRHVGVGRRTRASTVTERRLRAHRIWLQEVWDPIDPTWTVDEIIDRLVQYRFPEKAGA